MFTTAGFFKSALEECADIAMKDERQFNKTGVFKTVEMTNAEKAEAYKHWKELKDECELTKRCFTFHAMHNYYNAHYIN